MKILHAADLHLDSPFRSLPPEQAAQRRRELRDIPGRLARLAQQEGVDLVLLPGDLFDGERVYPESIQALKAALSALPVPVCIAPGNHDCLRPDSPYLTAPWPDHVHIFTSPALEEWKIPELNCVVHGWAFTGPRREDNPLSGFSAPADGQLHLLCAHGEVGAGSWYAPMDPRDLARSGMRYAALGHVHACSGLRREGDTFWAYPGCPEGRGFDETGEKGCLLVDVGDTVSARFVPLCARQYRVEHLPAEDFAQTLAGEKSEDLVRLILTGETAVPPDLAALTALAAPHFFYVELRDGTTLPQDLWARGEEDSLTGLFLREMGRRLDQAAPEDRDKVLLATRFGLAALEGGEDIRP